MRRHLEAAKFQQAQSAARTVRVVELVYAKLCAMSVAGDVGQQMPKGPVGDPRFGWGALGKRSDSVDFGEGDLEFVERLGAALVHPRCLRRGADESTGEQVGQRRVPLPIGQQA